MRGFLWVLAALGPWFLLPLLMSPMPPLWLWAFVVWTWIVAFTDGVYGE